MKTWLLLAFFAIGLVPAVAHDPPGYPRALIGHVTKIVPQGVVVESVTQNQLRPISPFPPGVEHECFEGGTVLVRGLRTPYKVGDRIEIMITETDDTYVLNVNPTQQLQLGICNMLSEHLAFPVGVDWDPSATATASAPATPPPSSPTKPSATSPDWSPGSLDDPIPGTHK
jgi:hypothetical protein